MLVRSGRNCPPVASPARRQLSANTWRSGGQDQDGPVRRHVGYCRQGVYLYLLASLRPVPSRPARRAGFSCVRPRSAVRTSTSTVNNSCKPMRKLSWLTLWRWSLRTSSEGGSAISSPHGWIGHGRADCRNFLSARGLERDRAAVEAALKYEWSSGQVEGQITRLKLRKRQSFGRAGFSLLKRQVLQAA